MSDVNFMNLLQSFGSKQKKIKSARVVLEIKLQGPLINDVTQIEFKNYPSYPPPLITFQKTRVVCRTPKVRTYVVRYPLQELPVHLAHRELG